MDARAGLLLTCDWVLFGRHSYVRGLLRVSDTLWKWCAEFTQRHPWVFIFFEDTDTSWLLPENVDRCIDELAGHADRNRYAIAATRHWCRRLYDRGRAARLQVPCEPGQWA